MTSKTAKMLVDTAGMIIPQYYDSVNDVYVAVTGLVGFPSINVGSYPLGATPVHASSGNQANAPAIATLPAVSGKTNYLTGIDFTGGGAAAGGLVTATIVGLLGGTRTYTFTVPTGVTLGAQPLLLPFNPPLTASASNIAIVVTLPALGAGSTNASSNAQGYVV